MIRIYLANLKKYNEGRLIGKWVSLPCYTLEDEVSDVLTDFGQFHEGHCEEYAIHDYEGPIRIDEYDDINELNELAQAIENAGISENAVEALYSAVDDIAQLPEIIKNHEYTVVEDVFNYTELAEKVEPEYLPFDWYAVEGTALEPFIDWEAVGRELDCGGEWYIYNRVGICIHR